MSHQSQYLSLSSKATTRVISHHQSSHTCFSSTLKFIQRHRNQFYSLPRVAHLSEHQVFHNSPATQRPNTELCLVYIESCVIHIEPCVVHFVSFPMDPSAYEQPLHFIDGSPPSQYTTPDSGMDHLSQLIPGALCALAAASDKEVSTTGTGIPLI